MTSYPSTCMSPAVRRGPKRSSREWSSPRTTYEGREASAQRSARALSGHEDVIIALAERPKRDNPVVPSLVEVWTGAEYQERETYEMLGVNFQGHPDLRKILLPEDWNDLPPLRKDYNSPGR